MKVNVLLADSAQVDPGGKVHALGIGWTRTTAPTNPMAVVVLLDLDDQETAEKSHEVLLELIQADGKPASIGPANNHVRLTAKIEPQPGSSVEIPIVAPVVVQLGPLDLAANEAFTWRATVDGVTHEDWAASFLTHQA